MKLIGVMVNSDNPKVLGEFYGKIFGKPGWEQDGEWFGFDTGLGSLMIGPHSEVSGKAKEPQRLMISYEAEDVKAAYEKVKQAGAEVVAEPYQPSPDDQPDMWLATLSDPDGNYIQISKPWK